MTATSTRARTYRLLAVDDSLTICKMVELTLRGLEYHLDVARTGQEGIERAQRHLPDLILLDYVLPDMKGHEISHALSANERTRNVPIMIMSAKVQEVKPLFANNPAVVGFLSKPFTPEALRFQVEEALRKSSVTDRRADPGVSRVLTRPTDAPAGLKPFSYAQQEAAAQALYQHLSERFARIPEWMGDLDRERPGPHFARRILTPELMPKLMDALLPIYREVIGPRSTGPQVSATENTVLSGQVGLLGIRRILNVLAEDRQTGLLEVEHEGRTDLLYLRLGQIVFATHNRPEQYLRQGPWSPHDFPAEEWERAEDEQRCSGRPLYLGIAKLKELSDAELSKVLFEQGKRVLREVLEVGAGTFRWLHPESLPEYVEAYGQPHPLEQLYLDSLRRVDDWAQIEVVVGSLGLIFARGHELLTCLPRYDLNAVETRVLNLVNGRRPVRQLVELTGLPPFQVFQALFCMNGVGLVRCLSAAGGLPVEQKPTVMILDPDVEGVHEPLARLLRRRQVDPISLVSLNGERDVLSRLIAERPRLVLLNSQTDGLHLAEMIKRIRTTLEISDVNLAAILDAPGQAQEQQLLAMGFDSVLVKPFALKDVMRLIAA